MDEDSDDLQQFSTRRDEAAFARLVRRHADFVYATCLRQTRDPSLADDAAQAVFILLARKAGSIRNAAALAAWLHNVSRYASANAMRSEKRRRRHEASVAILETTNSTPVSDAIEHEVTAKLDQAMARLSPRDREVIVMRYFQQKSHEEIADAISGNGHAAKMRVLRALDKLRAALAR